MIRVCYCFGIDREEIVAEVERTGSSASAERIAAEIKAGRCDCERLNPAGVCCLGEVRRIVAEQRRRTG